MVTFIFKSCYIQYELLNRSDGGKNMDDKKKYIEPVIQIIEFDNNDIITYSTRGTAPDDWGETPDAEDWGN